MPKRSKREELLGELEFVGKRMILEDKDRSPEFREIMELENLVENCRYLDPKVPVPKQEGFFDMFWNFSDVDFVKIVRMTKETFSYIVGKIQNHSVFQTPTFNKQVPVWQQLAVALNRFGCEGNGAGVVSIAILTGISRGAVVKYTERVITAILSLKEQFLYWPNPDEREIISNRFATRYGLPGTVGIIDGTYVNLFQRPGWEGSVYFNRKCRYAMNVQLVCDDRKFIRCAMIGWPGSCYDNTIWQRSDLFQRKELYFSAGEFLLADAGYTNSAVSCVPYKNPEAQLPDNELFNHLFSQARCMIEHVNGILKSRFMSLKNLRIKVHKKEDFAHVNEWILFCCILYNMCKVQVDEWPDAVENEEEDLQYVLHLQNMHANEGIRDRVQAVLLQWYHATQPV